MQRVRKIKTGDKNTPRAHAAQKGPKEEQNGSRNSEAHRNAPGKPACPTWLRPTTGEPPSGWTCTRRAANPAPAGYGTAAVSMDECRPGSEPSRASYEAAAVRMDVCAPRTDAQKDEKTTRNTHTRASGVVSSDQQGNVSASTQNSPGTPAESLMERGMLRETGPVSHRVTTRTTTAAHTAQDGRWRHQPGTTPSRRPGPVQRGASPARPPGRAPAAGTMSPVVGRPPGSPRSRPVKQGVRAPGREGTTSRREPTRARRATGPDEARRTKAGARGTPDRQAAGHNEGTGPGGKQPQAPEETQAKPRAPLAHE